MAERKKYFDELNIFRALIIIWVIIGHSFNAGLSAGGFLHAYAYSFHMNAFFLLSGLLFAGKTERIKSVKQMGAALLERAKRLLVPYFFFSAVSYVLKLIFERYAKNELSANIFRDLLLGINNPNGGIWFLYSLFMLSAAAVLLYKLPKWLMLLFFTALYFTAPIVPISTLPILHTFFAYGIYFFGGLFLRKYYDEISVSVTHFINKARLVTVSGTGLYIVISAFLVYFVLRNEITADTYINYCMLFLLTVFNILVHYLLAHCITLANPLKKPLMCVGDYGMDIYMLGYYVQTVIRVILGKILAVPYAVYSPLLVILGLFLPIPISHFIVRRFKVTRALMLGDFSEKSKN